MKYDIGTPRQSSESMVLAMLMMAIWSITKISSFTSFSTGDIYQFLSDVIFGQFILLIPAFLISLILMFIKKKFNFIIFNSIIVFLGIILIMGNFLN